MAEESLPLHVVAERVLQYAPDGRATRDVTVRFMEPQRQQADGPLQWECLVEIEGLDVEPGDKRFASRCYPGVDSMGALLGAMQAVGILLGGDDYGLTWLGDSDLGFPSAPPARRPAAVPHVRCMIGFTGDFVAAGETVTFKRDQFSGSGLMLMQRLVLLRSIDAAFNVLALTVNGNQVALRMSVEASWNMGVVYAISDPSAEDEQAIGQEVTLTVRNRTDQAALFQASVIGEKVGARPSAMVDA